jgi:hypothetical protein
LRLRNPKIFSFQAEDQRADVIFLVLRPIGLRSKKRWYFSLSLKSRGKKLKKKSNVLGQRQSGKRNFLLLEGGLRPSR